MNDHFADWYRAAGVAPTSDELQKRWAGIELISKKPTKATVIALARIFAVGPQEVPETPAIVEAFRNKDDTFPLRENSNLLRTLAGAALRNIIEEKQPLATMAAFALVSASFGSRMDRVPERDHVLAAQSYLVSQSVQLRSRSASPSVKYTPLSDSKIDELFSTSVFQQNNFSNSKATFVGAFAELQSNIKAAFSDLAKVVAEANQMALARDEEIDTLWWLMTAFSAELNVPFKDIPKSAAPTILGVEYFDLLKFLPAPSSCIGLLGRALEMSQIDLGAGISFQDLVNEVPRAWRERRIPQNELLQHAGVCPLSFAMRKSLEVDGASEWIPAFKKACDIGSEEKALPLVVAQQVMNEQALLRLWAT